MKKHLSYSDRVVIEDMLREGKTVIEIAQALDRHMTSIYKEIKRGQCGNIYSAKLGHQNSQKNKLHNRRTYAIDANLALRISHLILDDHLSVPEVLIKLRDESVEDVLSVNTIYRAIDRGAIPNVSRDTFKNYSTSVFSNALIRLPNWAVQEFNIVNGTNAKLSVRDNTLYIEIERQTRD